MRRLAVLSSLLLLSCAADVGATRLAINDPLDLIDDIDPGGLRLFVLRAETYSCEATTGEVSPAVPDVEQGMFDDAIADVSLTVMGSAARSELSVPGGTYTVLVRGKGTDPVTNVPNTFIATGCTPVTIGDGETVEIRVTLIPIIGMGECGDGVFSPDEQCEDGNTTAGDGCSPTCRTEPFVISTTTGMQESPAVAGAAGRRWAITYDDSDLLKVLIRLLEPSGAAVTFPSALMTDATLLTSTGRYLLSDVALASDGRIGVSFASYPDVEVALFDADRNLQGTPALLTAGPGGKRSKLAFAGDGALLVAFENEAGLSGALFAAGSTSAGTPFAIGAGGASAPSVAGAADHFVVAFSAGGDVFLQRFGTDGTPRDASPVAVLEDAAGTQDQPSVGALPDGRVLVAWRDSGGDGAGTAIRARAFAADGSPAGAAITLNTTTAGDQSLPAVAGAGDRFFVAFQSGSSVRGRLLSSAGDPIPNREQPPTTADFELAAGGAQPAVATGGADGARAMIVWAEGGDIRGRFFPLAP